MHPSVMDWVRDFVPVSDYEGKSVLEVGSYDVNGSIRSVVEEHAGRYVGVDARLGPGVDKRVQIERLSKVFGRESFDAVFCVETLEHVQRWRAGIRELKAVLRRPGMIVLTTRSPGFPKHDHPNDYWRFQPGTLARAFGDFAHVQAIDDPDPASPGVFLIGWKPVAYEPIDLRDPKIRAIPVP